MAASVTSGPRPPTRSAPSFRSASFVIRAPHDALPVLNIWKTSPIEDDADASMREPMFGLPAERGGMVGAVECGELRGREQERGAQRSESDATSAALSGFTVGAST